jgi:hypothetical protein
MIRIVVHPKTTGAELAASVCRALAAELGDHPTLVGGAAVAIYTEGRFVSDDLDIVSYRAKREIAPIMKAAGFVNRGHHWEHPQTKLLIQFISPPIMIGRSYVARPDKVATRTGELPVISAFHSACDRLAWFLSDGDPQTLEQCADILATQKISLARVRRWLRDEDWPQEQKRRALELLEHKVELRAPPAKKRRRRRS